MPSNLGAAGLGPALGPIPGGVLPAIQPGGPGELTGRYHGPARSAHYSARFIFLGARSAV